MPRVQVILSAALDTRFTEYCEVKGHKKSTLAARLIKEYLDHEGYVTSASLHLSERSQEQNAGTQVQED